MNKYRCGATVDIGFERVNQEDFVQYKELDDNNLLCVIADGTGSREKYPQPAVITAMDIIEHIEYCFHNNPELFFKNPEFFLKDAFLCSNRVLGAFKLANEELFSGYAASVTAILFSNENKIYLSHCGNTRAYIMRNGILSQITRDHTKAQELLDEEKINQETYYVHPDRLKMTSGIGIVINPEIQTDRFRIQDTDLVILTTDGIHYAIQQEFMPDLLLSGSNCAEASLNLVSAARDQVKYPDNMSAMVVHCNPKVEA